MKQLEVHPESKLGKLQAKRVETREQYLALRAILEQREKELEGARNIVDNLTGQTPVEMVEDALVRSQALETILKVLRPEKTAAENALARITQKVDRLEGHVKGLMRELEQLKQFGRPQVIKHRERTIAEIIDELAD